MLQNKLLASAFSTIEIELKKLDVCKKSTATETHTFLSRQMTNITLDIMCHQHNHAACVPYNIFSPSWGL